MSVKPAVFKTDDKRPDVVLFPFVPVTAMTPRLDCPARWESTSGANFLATRPGRFEPSPAPKIRIVLAAIFPNATATLSLLVIDSKIVPKSYEYFVYVSIHICVEIVLTNANDQLVAQSEMMLDMLSIDEQSSGASL